MRIRTIKPGFFKDEDLASLPALTRLLFQGLWCMADSAGRLEDRPKRIKVEVLPYDDYDLEGGLQVLAAAKFIVRYEVGGVRVIQVVNFNKHQRITGKEAETKSELPEMELGNSGKQQGNNGETTETTGREGKGKEGKGDSSSDSASPSQESAALPKPKRTDPHPNPDAEGFVDWFLALLADTGCAAPALTPSARYGWADAYDKLVRIDGKTREQVEAVCRWARTDSFWRQNFMAPPKLRDKKDGVPWMDIFANKMSASTTGASTWWDASSNLKR